LGVHRFVFLIELLAALAWLGVLASLANEGVHVHLKDKFDSFAIALTSLVALQSMLFIATTILASSKTLPMACTVSNARRRYY